MQPSPLSPQPPIVATWPRALSPDAAAADLKTLMDSVFAFKAERKEQRREIKCRAAEAALVHALVGPIADGFARWRRAAVLMAGLDGVVRELGPRPICTCSECLHCACSGRVVSAHWGWD